MGRPSKLRAGSDTSSIVNTANNLMGSPLTSPVNLSFHPSAPASRDGPAALDAARSRDVVAQQADSTVDRCPPTSMAKKRPSIGNVLRQLQSRSATKTAAARGKQSSYSGENVVVGHRLDESLWSDNVAADLRVKRARYSAVQTPVRGLQSVAVGARASAAPLADITATGRRWSYDVGEDIDAETCPAATAVYEEAVGSPSVTSSGRRDSLDDDDDDDVADSWTRTCTSPLHNYRRLSSTEQLVDKKHTGLSTVYFV